MPAETFIAAGRRRHRVTVANPGARTPDGQGGYVIAPAVSPVPWAVAIDPTTADGEHVQAGATTATVTHTVTGPWRADVTSRTALSFNGRTLNVIAVRNPEERGVTLICQCVEVEAAAV